MQSPKFPLKRKDIEDVINASHLRSRWKEKVRNAMRTQPIPDPIEYLDFHVNLDSICVAIATDVCSGTYVPNQPTRFLSEKSKGLCRQLVIPSVKDALVLQSLSDALWTELRKKAPSKNAFYAPDDHAFSRVIRGHSSEYGSINAWLAFQRRILGFARTRNYIVVTDIANYYDFISYDHLRNIIADLAIAREHCLDLLIFTLSHMLWQPDYMPRVQIGLPQINLDAPRLLAHCFLFEIDNMFVRNPNVEFARYMDDIDVGCNDIATAKRVIRDLDLSLQTRQIRLNSGKTQILSHTQARRHFRIRENYFLNRLEDSINLNIKAGRSINREREFITTAIHLGLSYRRFEGGSGDKILKRLINYARKYSAQIMDDDFQTLLLKWPSIRGAALLWWQHSGTPEERLILLSEYVGSQEIIDDAALINMAVSLVSARLPSDKATKNLISKIISKIDPKSTWGMYSLIWILSKYGSVGELMRAIESTTSIWTTEESLSRVVGGMYPRLNGTPYFPKFRALIGKTHNLWSQSVFDFHQELASTPKGFSSVRKFLAAPNPSYPNLMSHSKFLMFLSAQNNPTVNSKVLYALKETHKYTLSDPHYHEIMATMKIT